MRSLILLLAIASPAIAQTNCGTALCNRLTPVGGSAVGANLTNSELALQLDTCLAQIALLQNEVISLRSQCNQCANGKNGSTGKQGPPGKDATVDYPKIYQWIKDHKSELATDGKPGEVDYTKIWTWIKGHKGDFSGTTPTLPSFVVNFLDGDGKIARTEPVTDGKINIPAQKAWWTRLDGKTEKQSRPLGDALKFQTELRQAKPKGAN